MKVEKTPVFSKTVDSEYYKVNKEDESVKTAQATDIFHISYLFDKMPDKNKWTS